jgi:uncharacterized Zn-finger protein
LNLLFTHILEITLSTATSAAAATTPAVTLDTKDLPAYCPNPNMPQWSSHPRVFLEIDAHGHAKCPYCGTEYQMKPGAVVHAH